jgi:hypothetical protein
MTDIPAPDGYREESQPFEVVRIATNAKGKSVYWCPVCREWVSGRPEIVNGATTCSYSCIKCHKIIASFDKLAIPCQEKRTP